MREHSIAGSVLHAVGADPRIARVTLVGSRAEGRGHELSDWDFAVEAEDFPSVADDMRSICAPLEPLAQQWDRLAQTWCWMLLLAGPAKVDLIFPDPHPTEPPWQPAAANLADIDAHFWDWILWLHSKQAKGAQELVAGELRKLSGHMLQPMGASAVPHSLDEAIIAYRAARTALEQRFGTRVPRAVERAVLPAVTHAPR